MRQKYIISILLVLLPTSLFAADDPYIGKNLGFDFYTTIDEGSYQMTKKIIRKKITEQSMAATRDCIVPVFGYAITPTDVPNDLSVIYEELDRKEFKTLVGYLTEKGVTSISIAQLNSVGTCLQGKYSKIKARSVEDRDALETLSQVGLYMDGDISNSDYDILDDINKINTLLFSEKIPYTGTKNTSLNGANNYVTPFSKALSLQTGGGRLTLWDGTMPTWSGSANPTNPNPIVSNTAAASSLASILGDACTVPATSSGISVGSVVDSTFLNELSATLANAPGQSANTLPLSNTASGNTSTGLDLPNNPDIPKNDTDHSEELPCSSIFCIDVKFNKGTTNLLAGGKTFSIESILDKHIPILDPIADSSLRAEKRTKEFGELSFMKIKLPNAVGGARIFISEDAQRTRPNIKDITPLSIEEKYKTARDCAYASVGLKLDPIESNGIGGQGLSLTSVQSTENAMNRTVSISAQDPDNALAGCYQAALSGGKRGYYDSFSKDLTEIQSFTSGLIGEITTIIVTYAAMYQKPTEN